MLMKTRNISDSRFNNLMILF